MVSTFAAAFPTLALATSCASAVKFRAASPMDKLGLIAPTLGQGQGIGVFVELVRVARPPRPNPLRKGRKDGGRDWD